MSVIDELLTFWNLEEADQTLDQLEDALITRDFGVATSAKICEGLREKIKQGTLKNPKEIRSA
jgi:fused signal recognition particle receptor